MVAQSSPKLGEIPSRAAELKKGKRRRCKLNGILIITLMADLQYEIYCKNGRAYWAIKGARRSLDKMDSAKYREKITFVAEGERYYYPWIFLQNINQR